LLLEVAWEVCNQLGGIYTVLRSKAPMMVDRWKSRYFLLGPYVASKAAIEFEPLAPPSWLRRVIERLVADGVVVHHGRWLSAGGPRVLLVEHERPAQEVNRLKHRLWEDHGIESPPDDALVHGVITFNDAASRILLAINEAWSAGGPGGERLAEGDDDDVPPPQGGRVLAHFHEWMGGLAIPFIRREQKGSATPIAITFTTHATQLGRALAYSDEHFYERLPHYDPDHEAAKYHLKTQHGIEHACASGAHCFTTVSPITGEECTHLLGRTPDVIVPNGFNIDQYNVGHDFQTFHAQFKDRIHQFVMGHFFPSYPFDLDKTLYLFTSGRYEPRNKGFDLCVEALARLNAELQADGADVTVVFFIITQRPTRSLDPKVLENRGVLNELRAVCQRITQDVGEQLFRRAATGERVSLDDLVDDYWRLRLRRVQTAMRSAAPPKITTHALKDELDDPLLDQLKQVRLLNAPEDRVKVVYHPEFIGPVNPLWGLEYDQFVRGCHLGVFPSSYEPWGYTPLECVALGVPAITSDLAGFGRYVQEVHPELLGRGMSVLSRRGRTFEAAAADLARQLLSFCKLDRRGRIALRNDVERRSWDFDWATLGRAYGVAHDLSLERAAAGWTAPR
jgi:glycogen synthase